VELVPTSGHRRLHQLLPREDVVVAFETLEHVADPGKFFREIKRILRPEGMLVISMPNPKVRKDLATGPSQVKELDAGEFRAMLSEHFSNYRLLGQRSVIGSAILPEFSLLSDADRYQTFRAADSGTYSVQEGLGPPTYWLTGSAAIRGRAKLANEAVILQLRSRLS
jgi:SAM-dependent methyltransferase